MAVNVAAVAPSEKRLAAALQHRFFLRLHMTAILTATVLVGLLMTRVLALMHLNIFAIRYALAVIGAYAAFVGFIKVWLWYVEFCENRDRRRAGNSSGGSDAWFDCVNLSSGGISTTSSGSSDALSVGGGRFGGGGAGGSWDDGDSNTPGLAAANIAASTKSGGSKSSGGGGGSSDLGELMLVVLIIALLVAIVASFAWIVYAAPGILSETAFNAALAGALVRHAHKATHGQWIGGVLRKTALPFLLVLALSVAVGWWAQHYCPDALQLRDAVHCAKPAF